MQSLQTQAIAPARLSRFSHTALASAAALAGFSPLSQAAFIEDSSATFETRNMYFNRDFRDGTSAQQSKRDEWAQGFMLNLQSGYTDGTVGFGVDALGMLGVKLDSSPDRTDTGLLPTHDDGKAADEYSKLGLTGKVQVSKTELKIGTLIPELPILKPNDGRILPQTFNGGLVTSKEFKNLVFTGGRLDKAKDRDVTHYEDIALNNKNSRFVSGATGKHLAKGERSLLDAFQSAAKNLANETGQTGPFDIDTEQISRSGDADGVVIFLHIGPCENQLGRDGLQMFGNDVFNQNISIGFFPYPFSDVPQR